MARMTRKRDLPTKLCATCGKPFAWRKKWERVWDEVRYCSDRCRADNGKNPNLKRQHPARITPRQ
ncbi:MAG: DUF2256 domain-containing protein [Pseudomonadota bacterium]